MKNIFKCCGLNRNSVTENSLSTASDGRRYNVKVYNLDAIISIGYRVNSVKGVKFRQWSTKVLKEYTLKGLV
ncbi:RhuM family protein [Anaerorhabdus furcosa]|uniref:RhuM family protein n=1 Tax=Anaerorhabdus furcosa TaxID=118967 RepID=UPI002477FB0D|nr:RhuM family protein [Anaerorhabdus furcosa]